MRKKYTWDSVAKRLAYEGQKIAEKNGKRPDGGNCVVVSAHIIVGCDGQPVGLLHPTLTKLEPVGDWVVFTNICEDI